MRKNMGKNMRLCLYGGAEHRRLRFCKILTALISSLFFLVSSFAAEDDPVLARAYGHLFRQSEYEKLIRYAPHDVQRQVAADPAQKEKLIEAILQQRIIADQARSEQLDKEGDVEKQLQYITDAFLSSEYLRRRLITEINTMILNNDEAKERIARGRLNAMIRKISQDAGLEIYRDNMK